MNYEICDDGGNIFADANASRVNTYRKNSVTISKNVKLTNKGTIQIGGILGSENVTLSGTKILTAAEIKASSFIRVGDIYIGDSDSHGLDWEVQVAKGDTMANQGWHKLIFKKGILCGHSSS